MTFEDDKPLMCHACNDMIYPGETALRWHEHNYCGEECLQKAMFDEFCAEVEEVPVLSASNKADIYADMMEE